MTLASRFSTAANKGIFNSSKQRWSMITGNMALIQVQAGTIAFIAAMVAMLMSWIPSGEFNLSHALILISASLYTAAIASLILSSLMMFIIIYSEKHNINPDNVATPVAASLGDLCTVSLLAFIAQGLYDIRDTHFWVLPCSVIMFLLSVPFFIYIAHRCEYTNKVLYDGWEPVIAAMFISR